METHEESNTWSAVQKSVGWKILAFMMEHCGMNGVHK
jgi:hypothetical protein